MVTGIISLGFAALSGFTLFLNHKLEKKYEYKRIKLVTSYPAKYENLLREPPLDYKPVALSPYELLVGYDFNKQPIILDVKKFPSVLIGGLANQGKSGCIRQMIKNLFGADYVVLNGFRDDFPDAIIGDEVNVYLKELLGNLVVREVPLYIFIDELALITNTQTLKYIEKLLCAARHYNIFVIGCIQRPSKKSLEFKDLFTAAITFRQRDNTNYKLIIDEPLEYNLEPREFAMLTDNLYYGRTYNL